jgi:hypothetical protein
MENWDSISGWCRDLYFRHRVQTNTRMHLVSYPVETASQRANACTWPSLPSIQGLRYCDSCIKCSILFAQNSIGRLSRVCRLLCLPVNHLTILSAATLLGCSLTATGSRLIASIFGVQIKSSQRRYILAGTMTCYVTRWRRQRLLNADTVIAARYECVKLFLCSPHTFRAWYLI